MSSARRSLVIGWGLAWPPFFSFQPSTAAVNS